MGTCPICGCNDMAPCNTAWACGTSVVPGGPVRCKPPCPECAALREQVARLKVERDEARDGLARHMEAGRVLSRAGLDHLNLSVRMAEERDEARTQLATLAANPRALAAHLEPPAEVVEVETLDAATIEAVLAGVDPGRALLLVPGGAGEDNDGT